MGDRIEPAVKRIEAALARISRAADAPAGAQTPPSVIALVERHERLRENVAQALAQLDRVIGEIDQ